MDAQQRLAELLGVPELRELPAGHQSRVFETVRPWGGQRLVVKVVEASLVDPGEHRTRVQVAAELGDIDVRVCRPLPISETLVTEIDLGGGRVGLATCYEHAGGVALHAESRTDATRMGRTLATLHDSMRAIGPKDLPLVAALRAVPLQGVESAQLLHGDFSDGNLRDRDGLIRVFDFDDCGYGPASFDVANALYMALFSEMTGDGAPFYATFEEAFLSGYAMVCGHDLDAQELRYFIDLRVAALERWLRHPDGAPIGLRNVSPEWQRTLRRFVADYHARFG